MKYNKGFLSAFVILAVLGVALAGNVLNHARSSSIAMNKSEFCG